MSGFKIKQLLLTISLFLIFNFTLYCDDFTTQFYEHVNEFREKLGLNILEQDIRIEKIATEYSTIMAQEEFVNYNVFTEFKFASVLIV